LPKELKASVKLDTSNAVRSLEKLENRISKIQKLVNRTSTATNKFSAPIQKATRNMQSLDSANRKAANSANQIAKGYQKSSKSASILTKNLRTLISTYVGIMGARAVLNTSDILTSAKNKLNYVNDGNTALTQEQLDKTYAAAQRSRGGYANMLSNTSKSMMLASDAFQNNVDNAIRFQEIMSKAYTVGGASAAEQSSSMYQLVQALGSGILQGDELRSVREGAPIAYKEIEKFAQGVYDTKDSLKELASQGLITSDIVVAAIMNAGESIDKAFENTDMTFAQAFENIKNMAVKAFEPVLQVFNDALNKAADSGLLDGIGNAFVFLANTVLWVMNLLGQFFNWFAENWYWLQWIVYAVIAAIIIWLGVMAAQSVWAGIKAFWAFITGMSPLYIWIIVIGIVVAAIVWLTNTAVSGMEFIFYALLMVAAGLVLVAVLTQAWWLLWVVLAIVVVALILMFLEQIVGGVYWLGAVCYNVAMGIANFFIACWQWICAVVRNVIDAIVNFAMGLWNSINAICQNIGIAFNNAWYGALSAFWDFIADCVEGLDWLAKPLSKIAELFGKSFSYDDFSATIRSKADGYASKQKEYVSVSDAWANGASTKEYESIGDAWSDGMSTLEYKNLGEAYSNGAAVGAGWSDSIGSFGDGLKNDISNFDVGSLLGNGLGDILGTTGLGTTNGLFNKLGDGSGGKGSYLPDPNDPANRVGGSYDPSKALKGIKDDTGSIADSMDLTDEDLEYLRKLAEMEWKKEFTTATIKVDMSNYNNINGMDDLDGIATRLADKLYEEMDAVANGVYQ